MNMELGKIESVLFGHGGYNEGQIGLWLTLSGKGWGVSTDINGGWSCVIECTKYCKWTEGDRDKNFARCMREISKLLIKAKVNSIDKLKGLPVEVMFDRNQIWSWRILEEVL